MSENILTDPKKSLQRYLVLESILRTFFDEQAKDFCKYSIPEEVCYPRFCCSKTGLEKSSHSEAHEELIKSRLERYGEGDLDKSCAYYSNSGCLLKTHKPVICIAHACEPLVAALKDKGISYDRLKVEHILNGILLDKNPLYRESLRFGITDEEFWEIKIFLQESLKPSVISPSKP